MNQVQKTLKAIAKQVGVDPEVDLTKRKDGDPEVGRCRLLAAHLLEDMLDRADVLYKLNCTTTLLARARNLARENSVEGATFRADLKAIKDDNGSGSDPDVSEPAEDDSEPKKSDAVSKSAANPDPEELLFRIAKEEFGLTRDYMLEHSRAIPVAQARRIMICIASEFFLMKSHEIAKTFSLHEETVKRLVRETGTDYSHGVWFPREVDNVRKKYGIVKISACMRNDNGRRP